MQMSAEDMVRLALLREKRTRARIADLNTIRTRSNPPLNTASKEVMAEFAFLTRRAGELSDEEYKNRVHKLRQLNYESHNTVTVWVDDLLDEIGLVGNVVLREEATNLLLGGPEERANPAPRMERYKELFERGGRKEKMDAWREKLHADYPNVEKIVYKAGRSPYAEGSIQSLYTL